MDNGQCTEDYACQTVQDTVVQLHVDPAQGLNNSEVAVRLAR